MTHTITLVATVHVSKQEALESLSRLLGEPVDDSDPSDATITMTNGVVISIEVPKFGEDLPLTLDLSADSQDILRSVTAEVIDAVDRELHWSLKVVGGN